MANNFDKKKNLMPKTPKKPNYQLWIILVLVAVIFGVTYFSQSTSVEEITSKRFERMAYNNDISQITIISNQKQVEVTLKPEALNQPEYEELTNNPFVTEQGPHFKFKIIEAADFKEDLEAINAELPEEGQIEYEIEDRSDFTQILSTWGFLFLILFVFWFLMRRMTGGGGPGGQIFNIGKSKAALFDAENKVKITFDNVAGLDEAKEEVKEIVEFLKNPTKFTKLGGKIPKGALLVGAPGTGIDEIDAIGRSRGRGQMPGSNDERENTLNSLLVEMDGFSTDSGVIILAASNRPDVLDSALLRPGRFDRQISIDKPDLVGRDAIFKVHLKPIKLSKDVDVKKLAAQTPGFAGAEIANVCNEAALIAARKNKDAVDMQDFHDAIDRVIGGLEKKNKIISPEEKKIVAYHEAGHAVAGWFLEHADPLVKVSIVPRGVAALGYAQYLPKEQFLYQTEQLLDEMSMALGGRAAEEIIFGKISTGALSDLERVTKVAYSMVSIYGMNDKIGNISYYDSKPSDYNFNKPYSEATAETIDHEVRQIVDKAYQLSKNLLLDKKNELELVAKELLEKEIIFQNDLERLIGKRPFSKQTAYQAFTQGEKSKPQRVPDASTLDEKKESKKKKDEDEDVTYEKESSAVNGKNTDKK